MVVRDDLENHIPISGKLKNFSASFFGKKRCFVNTSLDILRVRNKFNYLVVEFFVFVSSFREIPDHELTTKLGLNHLTDLVDICCIKQYRLEAFIFLSSFLVSINLPFL